MRRYKIILYILASVLISGTSCKKFLYQEPYNDISLDDIFRDFEGARTTLSGCYNSLMSFEYYSRNFSAYPELTGGTIRYSKTANLALEATYNFQNDELINDMSSFYEKAYSTIYGANNIITYVDNAVDASQLQKNRMVADALVIRALAHFDLMRVFAQSYNFTSDASHPGIIIRTVNENVLNPSGSPATASQVFEQITKDLDSAISLYPNSTTVFTSGTPKGWLTLDAAKALKSRVALYKNDWETVISLTTELISANKYPLLTTNQYVNSWSRKNVSNESIFELVYGNRTGGSIGDYYNPLNTMNGQWASTSDLRSLYAVGDVRGQPTMFVQATVSSTPFFFSKKYLGTSDSANNIKIIRASELYLNRAEAYAESDDLVNALKDLNTIRKRAHPAAATFTSDDKQTVINEILIERRKELAFESHAFFDLSRKRKDLVRTDCTGPTCSLTYPDPRYAVPRPVRQ